MKHVVVGIITRQNKENETEYLLVSSIRESFGEHSGSYYPPGGHLEDGETEQQALVREIEEELGLVVTPVQKLAETPGDIKDQITHWWSCEIVGGELRRDENELADAGFFTRTQMQQLKLWPATKNFFETYIFI